MSELALQPTERELVMLRLNGDVDLGKQLAKIPKEKLPIAVLEWLAAVNDRSANTEDAYHRAVSAWLTWCLAGEPIVDPHRARLADAEAWNRHMKNNGLSDRTRNQRISACSALYRRLLAEEFVERNPFAVMTRSRVSTDEATTPALSDPQAKRVMAKALADKEHLAHRAILELLFTTGARASEIANAKVGDLSADERGMVLKVLRKGGKRQSLPVTSDALKAITEANAGRSDMADETRPLLLAPRGGSYSRHTISRLVARYANSALARTDAERKLAHLVTAHTTRRTAVTSLADAGVDLRIIQTFVGHSDPRTTEGYIRSSKDRRNHSAAAETLAARFHSEDD